MSDARINPEAPPSPEHVAVFRKDYRPPDWLGPQVTLEVALNPDRTIVRATLKVERNGDHDRPLRLAGSELELLSVSGGEWRMDDQTLVLDIHGDCATIQTEVAI